MKIKDVVLRANVLGLFLTYYNPGDNPTYQLATVDVSYFAVSSSQQVYRAKTLKDIRAFLTGYAEGKLFGHVEGYKAGHAEGFESGHAKGHAKMT